VRNQVAGEEERRHGEPGKKLGIIYKNRSRARMPRLATRAERSCKGRTRMVRREEPGRVCTSILKWKDEQWRSVPLLPPQQATVGRPAHEMTSCGLCEREHPERFAGSLRSMLLAPWLERTPTMCAHKQAAEAQGGIKTRRQGELKHKAACARRRQGHITDPCAEGR
jgi:hypothetical protein